MVLVFENYCHGEEAKTVITHVIENPHPPSVDLENQTPHGTVTVGTLVTAAGGLEPRVQVTDYGSDEGVRKEMTTVSDVVGGGPKGNGAAVTVVSKPYHFASILGFDVSCEKAHQALTAPPGTTLGGLRLTAASSARVDISPTNPFVDGKHGMRVSNVTVRAEVGRVLMRNLDVQGEAAISTAFAAPSFLQGLTDATKTKAAKRSSHADRDGLVDVDGVRASRITIDTVGGAVFVQNVDVREGALWESWDDEDDGEADGEEKTATKKADGGAAAARPRRPRRPRRHGVVITTSSGEVEVQDDGRGGDITVTTGSGDVHIVLSGRYFSGRYNLQTQEGVVYVNPTNNMHAKGPQCSAEDSWMGLPKLHQDVSRMNGHCEQGQLGFAYGARRLVVLSESGDIDVFVRGDYPS
eukprot:g2332.t1